MGQVLHAGSPPIHSALLLASESQRSRTCPSMSSQLHVKAGTRGGGPPGRQTGSCRTRRARLRLLVGTSPPSAHQAWGLCGNMGPLPRPLAMAGWGETLGQKPGPTDGPAAPAGDRHEDRQNAATEPARPAPASTGEDVQNLLSEGVPSGTPQAPQIMRKIKAFWGPERVWPHLVAQPCCGWVGDTKTGGHRRKRKSPAGTPLSGAPPSAYGNT